MGQIISYCFCIFPETYSDIIFVIGELNWKDVVNNPINELSDDDENYVFSYDLSLTDDDNNDYDEMWISILYLKSKGIISYPWGWHFMIRQVMTLRSPKSLNLHPQLPKNGV